MNTGLSGGRVLQDSRLGVQHEVALPNEVRSLICGFVDDSDDLETLKSLRLVSKGWAYAAVAFLLRGTFAIKSDLDVERLMNVTSDINWASQAARTINTIQIQNTQLWCFPRIYRFLLERVVHVESPDTISPDIRAAIHELEGVERNLISARLDSLYSQKALYKAFKCLHRLHAIDFAFSTPFKHPLLREICAETVVEAYETPRFDIWTTHLKNVLFAASEAGLDIQHFTYSQLPSSLFITAHNELLDEICQHLSGLRSLSLTINDGSDNNSTQSISFQNNAVRMLDRFTSSFPGLEALSLRFTGVDQVPLAIFPVDMAGRLHTLSLMEVSISSATLLPFLELHKTTLRRLSLGHVKLQDRGLTCQRFLEDLKILFTSFRLEKFEFWGQVTCSRHTEPAWWLQSIYENDWEDKLDQGQPSSNQKTKQLEKFVLRNGPWPMTEDDDISQHLRIF
jgi:hypothetical protein